MASGRSKLRNAMQKYYQARAPEYDLFYEVPERLEELAILNAWLVERTKEHIILEIAAGTGYWTEVAARVAKSITATDCHTQTLEIAATRQLRPNLAPRLSAAFALPN